MPETNDPSAGEDQDNEHGIESAEHSKLDSLITQSCGSLDSLGK